MGMEESVSAPTVLPTVLTVLAILVLVAGHFSLLVVNVLVATQKKRAASTTLVLSLFFPLPVYCYLLAVPAKARPLERIESCPACGMEMIIPANYSKGSAHCLDCGEPVRIRP